MADADRSASPEQPGRPDDKTDPETADPTDTDSSAEIVEAELLDVDVDDLDDEAPQGMESMIGALGGLDMESLLGSAMQMQQEMMEAQQEAAETEVEGQSGGGVVRVVMTGSFDFRRVEIAPEAVDPDDVEMLQDLVLAAMRDAVNQAVELTQSSMPSLGGMGGMGAIGGMGGAGLGGGGIDLGDLLGGLGGAAGVEEYDDELDDGPSEDDEQSEHDGHGTTPS